jgi:aryl-alcohol dehydrogenase-like predicted oxidoreductase
LGGILSGSLDGRRASEDTQKELAEKRDVIKMYEDLCSRLGESPADVAIAWLIHQPGITAPIIGPRTSDQLEANIHAASIKLDSQFLNELDAIFPGPGGSAPEAYAW